MPRKNGYAEISADGRYRYKLGGDLNNPRDQSILLPSQRVARAGMSALPILWIMLNPSTADAENWDKTADATIRTITLFSELWGYSRLMVGNLYAWRATDPKDLVAAWRMGMNVVGPRNEAALAEMCSEVRGASGKIMVAWGAGFTVPKQMALFHKTQVAKWVGSDFYCLKRTKDGSPVHPLYQPHNLTPTLWEAP